MLTFVGVGYTPAFTKNYRRIAERLSAGEEIELVSGPDDICAPMLGETNPHCRGESVVLRDEAALSDIGALLGRQLAPGSRIAPDLRLLAMLRRHFVESGIRAACRGCEWQGLCSHIADSGFEGVLINPR
jgi:hypothetical protein